MNGWKKVPISDVVESPKTWNPSRSTSDEVFKYIDLSAVDQESKSIVGAREVSCKEAPSRARQLVVKGDILVSTVRPNLNGVAQVPEDLDGATASTGFCILRPHSSLLDGRFLFHWVKSPIFISDMVKKATGASYPAVSDRIILDSILPLPSLQEQKRIADILDRAETLRAKRRAALAQLDELTQAIFFDMFGDPFTQNDSTIRLGDVADIFMGQSPPGSSYNSTIKGTPLLNGPTEFGELYPIEKQWTTEPTRLCEVGDILFCVRGATAGRLNRADKVYCLGRGLAAIRPRRGTAVNADFLFTMLDHYYEYFQTKGVGSTFINISKGELEALPIPKVQHDKVNTFSHLVEAINKLKIAHKASLVELDELFASLQYRAFKGEL